MKRALEVNVVVPVLWMLCVVSLPCSGGERDWPITVLDSDGDVGQQIDMQIDSDGHLHIIYLRADTGVVKIISQDAGGWATPVDIDDNGSAVGYCAVATTLDGQLPVSYKRDDTNSLYFAGSEEPKNWSVSAITAEPDDVGRYLSAVMEASGTIALGFRNETDTTLKTMRRETGTWTPIETVDSEPDRSKYIDLTYRPGVGYAFSAYAASSGYLAFADPEIQAAPWSVSAVTELADDVGTHLVAIGTGASDLALSFRNESEESLLHMRRESGEWSAVETVDANPGRGLYSDLAQKPGGGYSFSAYASAGGFLTFADPEIQGSQWIVGAVTELADDVGTHLAAIGTGGSDLALSFRNESEESLLHMRRESGEWSEIETVDPNPGRSIYSDLAQRPGGGYSFSAYDDEEGSLIFADPEIEARPWFIRSVDHHVDVGHQLAMVKGQNGYLDYAYLGLDEHSSWHVRAGEFLPDSVRILSTVADSVAVGSDDHVYPDLFVTPNQDWAVTFRDDTDGYLYLATTEDWQIELQSVPDPVVDDDFAEVAGARLNAVSNPVREQLRVRFSAVDEAPVLLQIYDATGRLVSARESRSRRGVNLIDCDTRNGSGSELAGGVYFLRLRVGDTNLGTKRFVLVR